MDNIFVHIIPLTIAMTLPMPMLKATRSLLYGRPILYSMIIIITWGITLFFTLNIVVTLGVHLKELFIIKSEYIFPENSTSWMQILIGLAFIAIGVGKLDNSLKPDKRREPVKQVGSTALLTIKSTIKVELFSIKNFLLLLLLIYILIRVNMPSEKLLIVSGFISITAMFWMSVPLVVYFLAGRSRKQIMGMLRRWLDSNKDVLMIFIYLSIGITSLSAGVGGMIPSLLENIYEKLIE
ncbi:MAG: GAP family protein [Campylobacterota bacterium]|nr:GAP family protein [Campylobacterota bacterium]